VEGIGILIALDAIPDVFKTVVIVTGHMASTSILSRRGGVVADEEGTDDKALRAG